MKKEKVKIKKEKHNQKLSHRNLVKKEEKNIHSHHSRPPRRNVSAKDHAKRAEALKE